MQYQNPTDVFFVDSDGGNLLRGEHYGELLRDYHMRLGMCSLCLSGIIAVRALSRFAPPPCGVNTNTSVSLINSNDCTILINY